MTRKNVIRFPGNDAPASRRASSATIIILPVIRRLNFDDRTQQEINDTVERMLAG